MTERRDDKPFRKKDEKAPRRREERPYKKRDDKPFQKRDDKPFKRRDDKPFQKRDDKPKGPYKKGLSDEVYQFKQDQKKETQKPILGLKEHADALADKKGKEIIENDTRLNKYIANAGICSRRDADELIQNGEIRVNGKVMTNLGERVTSEDRVEYKGRVLKGEKTVYVLLNKPKDCITTMDDPQGRITVADIVESACKERIFPVGRLDRNTTGVLLITNDGHLAKKLTHPKHNIKKVYEAELNRPLLLNDFNKILEGINLEDGFIKPDELSYVDSSKKTLGIEIHSGKNRIIKRIFESLDYKVVKLDRVLFASLTKKDTPRGKWRFLTDKEVGFLKMIE